MKVAKKSLTAGKKFVFLLGSLIVIGIAYAIFSSRPDDPRTSTSNTSTTTTSAELGTPPPDTNSTAVQEHTSTQNEQLIYLIEEEKLAHDVYTVMYELYGSKVFGNILNSEQNHQSRVLTLLESRKIDDPRSPTLGVFNNATLQKLYDSLIAQGKQSAYEAYKVGVAIEELDIKDITKQLATATEADIVSTLEALRTGSENHLRAFNRQIGYY